MLLLTLTAFLALPRMARADDPVQFGPHDVRSVFYVSKSENQNQVHYAIRLDAACRPVSEVPVFAYWRRLRSGVRVDEPLVGVGRRLYGASDEQEVHLGTAGGLVRMYVKAIKRVRIDIRIEKTAEGCKATPFTPIHGEPARLSYAFLQLSRFGLGVKYVELVGTRIRDNVDVSEQLR